MSNIKFYYNKREVNVVSIEYGNLFATITDAYFVDNGVKLKDTEIEIVEIQYSYELQQLHNEKRKECYVNDLWTKT